MNEERKTTPEETETLADETEEMFCEYIDPDDLPEDEEYVDRVRPHFYHRKSFWALLALSAVGAIAALAWCVKKSKR